MVSNEALIAALRAFPAELATIASGIPEPSLRRPLADGWSPLQIIGHLKDATVIFAERASRLVEENVPFIPSWDQEEMAAKADYNSGHSVDFLDEIAGARERTVELLAPLNGAQWQRRGVHEEPEIGNFSLLWLTRYIVAHEAMHLADLQKAATG